MTCAEHDVAKELYAVTSAPPGHLCAAASDTPPFHHQILRCGRRATVHVGYMACDDHGSKALADRLAHALDRALGVRHHTTRQKVPA